MRWARFQSNSKLHELDPRPQGRNTTRGQRQRRVSSSGNAESVRQRSGQRARNSSGTHSASGQSSSRMRTQWTARELEQDMPISSSPRFKFHGPGISPQGRNTTRPRYRAGFQVSTTRSERASDPGSGPGLAVACTQHRVRAAAGCTHSGRPTGTGTRQGHRSSGAPRIKFHGAGIPDSRGSGPRGW